MRSESATRTHVALGDQGLGVARGRDELHLEAVPGVDLDNGAEVPLAQPELGHVLVEHDGDRRPPPGSGVLAGDRVSNPTPGGGRTPPGDEGPSREVGSPP